MKTLERPTLQDAAARVKRLDVERARISATLERATATERDRREKRIESGEVPDKDIKAAGATTNDLREDLAVADRLLREAHEELNAAASADLADKFAALDRAEAAEAEKRQAVCDEIAKHLAAALVGLAKLGCIGTPDNAYDGICVTMSQVKRRIGEIRSGPAFLDELHRIRGGRELNEFGIRDDTPALARAQERERLLKRGAAGIVAEALATAL